MKTLMIAIPALLLAASCSSDSSYGCPGGFDAQAYQAPNPSGKFHGEPCTSNSDCSHGVCYTSPNIGKTLKFCTKDCSSCPQNDCSLDGDQFTCIRLSAYLGETMSSFCGLLCNSLSDCPAGYTNCSIPTGSARKICNVQ